MTPKPAKMQNQDSAGSFVAEPIKNAAASVSDVIRIDTPPCLPFNNENRTNQTLQQNANVQGPESRWPRRRMTNPHAT
jgi:hypothetical protein